MERVCITGVSRGIGLGFARAYLSSEHQVFGTVRDINGEAISRLKREHPQNFTPVEMDVSDRGSVRAGVQEIRNHTDRLDLLINNAGVAREPDEQSIDDISEEDVRDVFNVNVLGPLRCVQEFVPLLRKGNDAKVVMIGSNAGSISSQGGGRGVPYCVSKAGLNMLTKLLYFHLRDEGIALTALHPGWVRTDMGGGNAALSVEESVAGMQQIIEKLGFDSPLYQDYRGNELPY